MADHEENKEREEHDEHESPWSTSAHAEVDQAGEHQPLRRPRHRRSATPKVVWVIAAGVVLAVLAALLWLNWPEADDTSVVTVQGVEYVTNVQVEDQNGYVYVLMPVNSDTESVVLEVADESDSQKIREFLDGLDTLVPGEHVLSLSDTNLHFILDGIEE